MGKHPDGPRKQHPSHREDGNQQLASGCSGSWNGRRERKCGRRFGQIGYRRFGGFLESLLGGIGRFVKKDQLLASYYTKDLLYTERLFLLSIPANEPVPTATKDFSQASIRTAGSANPQFPIDSLRGLGMSDLQIEEIHRTRVASPHVGIYSPVSGFVLTRNISPSQRFDKGTELFRIADLSRVWILVDVFEKDATVVQADRPVTVSLPSQGKTFTATVSKALPQFDNITRTLKLRLEAENPNFTLKPDMFVDVELPLSLAEAVVVPSEAVLDQGLRQTVFVDRGNGYFEPRSVHLGSRVGDQVQVVQGLTAGERIVTSGTFLLDSESRMKLAATGVQGMPLTDPVCGMTVDEGKAKAAKRVSEYQGKTYGFCSDGCKKKFDAAPAKYLAKAKPPAMTAATSEPKEAADPVCGMKVDVADARTAKLASEHQGKTYFFCNAGCKKQFDEAPGKYLAAVKAN